jgi:hypothetical protein
MYRDESILNRQIKSSSFITSKTSELFFLSYSLFFIKLNKLRKIEQQDNRITLTSTII